MLGDLYPPSSSLSSSSSAHARPIRVRRITCAPGPRPEICRPCFEFGESCTYVRPERRRGPRPIPENGVSSGEGVNANGQDGLGVAWQPETLVRPEVVEALTEAYHSIVYPIFPLFHWPTFMRDVHQQRYTTDRSFYTVVMVVCAIVSARLRNGALLPPSSLLTSEKLLENPQHSSESFHRLAQQAFPTNLTDAPQFNYRRAKALLAILCIQYGDVANLHTHLGDYETLSVNEGFYDETRWPAGLDECETQERRRLFWSTYTLQIFTAITWGGLVRQRQSQTNVLYPAEVQDDNSITKHGCTLPENPAADSFLRGWNVTTDMYRVLELLVDRLRARRFQHGAGALWSALPMILDGPSSIRPSSAEILDWVQGMYDGLDPVFKNVRTMVGNAEIDRYGFQAANLVVTLQTVKMVLAGTEESRIDQRCAIAAGLLEALATIPTSYIAAISAPMLYHLASVGHLLSNVIQQPLSQSSFLQVRDVLSALASLISGLESVLSVTSDISTRLKSHVAIIDEKLQSIAVAHAAKAAAYQLPPPERNLTVPMLPASQLTDRTVMPGQSNRIQPTEGMPEWTFAPPPGPPMQLSSTVPTGRLNTDTITGTTDHTDPTQAPGGALDWLFALSPEHQTRLQSDLTLDWPFDMGLSGSFDFWGHGQDWGSMDPRNPGS